MKDKDLTDILAECLNAIEKGERTVEQCLALYPEHREALAELLGTAAVVWEHADYAPRPSFRLSSRTRLLRRLSPRQTTAHRPSRKSQPAFSRRLIPLWTVLLVLIVALVGGGTVYASNTALPGDALHPIKLAIEDARLLLAGDAKDVSLASGFALTRLQEIQSLITSNREKDLDLAVALFSDRISTASDSLEAVAQTDPELAAQLGFELEQALSRHTEQLNLLLQIVPERAKPAIENAIGASNRGKGAIQQWIENGRPGGGPPENLPRPTQHPPGGPQDGNPNPPGGGPPEDVPGGDKTPPGGNSSKGTPGPPNWAPGINP